MTLAGWLLLGLALAPFVAAAAWFALGRAEPFAPGPDGYWRAPLRRTQVGLRVEPEEVRLHARAPRWQAAVGVFLIGAGGASLAASAARLHAAALPPPVARALERRSLPRGLVALALVGAAVGVLNLAASRRRTDVLLEARGDLRWHHQGWPRLDDGALPPAEFDRFEVTRGGAVLLRSTDATRPPVRLFGLRGLRRAQHDDDLRRATEAFRALAARRAAG